MDFSIEYGLFVFYQNNSQVPNSIGFVLGSAQLILYAIYKNKSISAKSTEEMEDRSTRGLVKGMIEMRGLEDDEEAGLKNRSGLHKGRSLPKPSVNGQNSFQRILKTLSLTPYEIHSNNWQYNHENDIEIGAKKITPDY